MWSLGVNYPGDRCMVMVKFFIVGENYIWLCGSTMIDEGGKLSFVIMMPLCLLSLFPMHLCLALRSLIK